MMNVDRSRRIANQVQQTLAKIISYDLADAVNDNRLKMITITDVRVTKDMRSSTIYISSFEQKQNVDIELVALLNENKGFLRKHLSQDLNLRVTPDLLFRHDEVIEQGARIDALLDQIKKKDETLSKADADE